MALLQNGCTKRVALVVGVAATILALPFGVASMANERDDEGRGRGREVQWVNHFDLLPGDPSVTSTSSNSTNSGVGGGLTGLVITSSTPGDTDSFGGNKVVHMALELAEDTKIKGVRLCYELSSPSSYITQIRLAQIQDPPATALVLLDDGTDLTAVGPVCVNSAILAKPISSRKGAVLLSFRVFTDPQTGDKDKIVIRAVGLLVH